MQWDARSAVSNKYSLLAFLNSIKIDIALLSETWLSPVLTIPLKVITLSEMTDLAAQLVLLF